MHYFSAVIVSAIVSLIAAFSLCLPLSAHAHDGIQPTPPVSVTHPCGAIGWLDGLRPLAADLEQDRGPEAMHALFHDVLLALLPAIDPRLRLEAPTSGQTGWTIHWADSALRSARPSQDADVRELDVRELYRSVLGEACILLSLHDPDKARRKLDGVWRDLWLEFEAVFIAALKDPAAAFGYSPISLSIKSPSVKSANESASLQWMDRSFGIARLYLSDLSNEPAYIVEELTKLRTEAPIRTLILDLRGSGGGDRKMLDALLSRFLPVGTLAYTAINRRGAETEIRVKENVEPAADREMRLIVLTSKQTRGGAELLAGALQANGRAIVIGEATAGMAGHKRIVTLSNNTALILTDALPHFPGQTTPVTRILPNVEAPAEQAIETALATLAEDGRLPYNPFIRPDEQRHSLVRAVLDRNAEEALRLIREGAELDVEASREAFHRVVPSYSRTDGDGRTPRIGYPLAIVTAALGMPKVLAAIGERAPEALRRTDSNGRTALAYAALADYPATTHYLLSQGFSPLHPAKRYPISNSPLQLAVELKHADIVAPMMSAIPLAQKKHIAVIESVWIAAAGDDLPTLKVLLEGGATPDYIALQGGTALIEAVIYRNLEAVRLLLQYGATVDDHPYR